MTADSRERKSPLPVIVYKISQSGRNPREPGTWHEDPFEQPWVMKAWLGDVLEEVCGNSVTAWGRPCYSWKSAGHGEALLTAFSPLFISHTVVFWEAVVKDTTWQLRGQHQAVIFLKIISLQLSCRNLCPVYPQCPDDNAERV